MTRWRSAFLALVVVMALGERGSAGDAPKAPVAERRSHLVTAPAGAREDDYYWLRDDTRKDPKMLAYLAAENAYTDAILKPLAPLKATLDAEFVARLKQDDQSVPYRLRGYWYYSRFETGKDYPVLARRMGAMTAPEDVLLDQNALAAGKTFFAIGTAVVSQDNRLLAYTEDTVGRRQYVLRFKDLASGKTLADAVPDVERGVIWADDNKTVFYIEKDPVTLLSKRVKAHVLGTEAAADRLVYEEKDDSFYIFLQRTRSDKYLCIMLRSTVTNEMRCAPAANPSTFALLAPRLRDHKFDGNHLNGRWVFRTNWNAKNYKLMTLADDEAWGDRKLWKDFVPHKDDVFIEDFELFDHFTALEERENGVKHVRVLSNDGRSTLVPADEPAYAMSLGENPEAATDGLRYLYTSLTTPETTYELDTKTGARTLLKRQPVIGYDPSNYVTERLWTPARDGTKIPVSLVYRKGFKKDGKAAMLQYAYGSYGASTDPALSLTAISLLDRGMVYAIAHVRGGQEMGRVWYDDGHLLHKKNTFTDFIDVTRFLVREGYAAKDRVAAQGGSAGGLLMGAIANMAPDDYRVIIAQVPFVDAVTTMLDETIPLTTNEFDEWGNPKEAKYYAYMLSYAPYDNVGAHRYPALFVGTGLWDSQVQYFEPTKWVAKLRATKTGDDALVLRVNMEAGHGGKSGRFAHYRDVAEYYAFMLWQLGVENRS